MLRCTIIKITQYLCEDLFIIMGEHCVPNKSPLETFQLGAVLFNLQNYDLKVNKLTLR